MIRISILLAVLMALPVTATAQDCAAGTRPFDHLGGIACIPEEPQRIVGLHDQQVTLNLIEIGAPVVGSHGRLDDGGTPFMRSVDILTGLDFENSGIAYVGSFQAMDFEAIAALAPDLIIGREVDLEDLAKYEAVAPTVLIGSDPANLLGFSRDVADAAGRLETWERLSAAYEANVARARTLLPQLDGMSYAKIQGWDGQLNVFAGYGGLTHVLHDLGMERVPFAQTMADRGVVWGEEVSAEILPELEADYIFDTYTIAYGDTLASPRERMDGIFPAWCDVLTACAEGRYVLLPREVAGDTAFAQLNTLLHLVTTHAARNLPDR